VALPSAEALPSVFYLALGKAASEKKRSAKPPALGKEADSGSDRRGKPDDGSVGAGVEQQEKSSDTRRRHGHYKASGSHLLFWISRTELE
jgi:hypothetical protein